MLDLITWREGRTETRSPTTALMHSLTSSRTMSGPVVFAHSLGGAARMSITPPYHQYYQRMSGGKLSKAVEENIAETIRVGRVSSSHSFERLFLYRQRSGVLFPFRAYSTVSLRCLSVSSSTLIASTVRIRSDRCPTSWSRRRCGTSKSDEDAARL